MGVDAPSGGWEDVAEFVVSLAGSKAFVHVSTIDEAVGVLARDQESFHNFCPTPLPESVRFDINDDKFTALGQNLLRSSAVRKLRFQVVRPRKLTDNEFFSRFLFGLKEHLCIGVIVEDSAETSTSGAATPSSASAIEESDDVEYTLLNIPKAELFRLSSTGHRAEEWAHAMWSGRCRVVSQGSKLTIKLVAAKSDDIFMQCVIPNGEHEKYVEPAVDSTHHFVLKIKNRQNQHTFIGLGIGERDASDFKGCLRDFRIGLKPLDDELSFSQPCTEDLDRSLSLKDGETIKVNLKGKFANRTRPESQTATPDAVPKSLVEPPPTGPVLLTCHRNKVEKAALDTMDFGEFQNADSEPSSVAATPTECSHSKDAQGNLAMVGMDAVSEITCFDEATSNQHRQEANIRVEEVSSNISQHGNHDVAATEHETYSQLSRLYRFATGEWEDRGTGVAKLLAQKETGQVRFMMRQEKTGKVLSNHLVVDVPPYCDLLSHDQGDRCWVWTAQDFAGDEMKIEKLALKFGTSEKAEAFKEAFKNAKHMNEAPIPVADTKQAPYHSRPSVGPLIKPSTRALSKERVAPGPSVDVSASGAASAPEAPIPASDTVQLPNRSRPSETNFIEAPIPASDTEQAPYHSRPSVGPLIKPSTRALSKERVALGPSVDVPASGAASTPEACHSVATSDDQEKQIESVEKAAAVINGGQTSNLESLEPRLGELCARESAHAKNDVLGVQGGQNGVDVERAASNGSCFVPHLEHLTMNAGDACTRRLEWPTSTSGDLDATAFSWKVAVLREHTVELEILAVVRAGDSADDVREIALQQRAIGEVFERKFEPAKDRRFVRKQTNSLSAASCSSGTCHMQVIAIVFRFSNRFSWFYPKDVEMMTFFESG